MAGIHDKQFFKKLAATKQYQTWLELEIQIDTRA